MATFTTPQEDTLELTVTQNGKTRNYIERAVQALSGYGSDCIPSENDSGEQREPTFPVYRYLVLQATGRAAAKVITIAEMVKEIIPNLHQINDLKRVAISRKVSSKKEDQDDIERESNEGNEDSEDNSDSNEDNMSMEEDVPADVEADGDESTESTERFASMFTITLSKHPLDRKHYGYQFGTGATVPSSTSSSSSVSASASNSLEGGGGATTSTTNRSPTRKGVYGAEVNPEQHLLNLVENVANHMQSKKEEKKKKKKEHGK